MVHEIFRRKEFLIPAVVVLIIVLAVLYYNRENIENEITATYDSILLRVEQEFTTIGYRIDGETPPKDSIITSSETGDIPSTPLPQEQLTAFVKDIITVVCTAEEKKNLLDVLYDNPELLKILTNAQTEDEVLDAIANYCFTDFKPAMEG